MNRIEELLNKFIPIKKKLETKDISELTNEGNTSILSLLKSPNLNNSLSHQKKGKKIINKQGIKNYHENNPNLKTKDKNKFLTTKYQEQNIPINNYAQKEYSPQNISQNNHHRNTTISAFNQNQVKYGQQNINKIFNKNIINNNLNDISNTNNANTPHELNLLVIDNKEVSSKYAQKLFEIERSKEMNKNNMLEKNSKNQLKNRNNHNENNMLDNDFDEDFDFLDDENENIEKKKKTNNNENTINDILVLCKNESLKEDQEDFDIFDKSKLIGVEEDNFNNDANNEDKNESFNKDNDNDNSEEPKKSINKPKKNESKNIKNKYKEIDKQKIKEDINEKNNNIIDEENNNNREILKSHNNIIRIEMEEDVVSLNDIIEEKNRNNKYQSFKNDNTKNKNVENIKNKKKKENHLNPIKKNNIKSKSCLNPNINNIDSRNNSKINRNKVIMDDEDEDNYDSNNKNSQNELFLIPEKDGEEKKNSLISNKGSKITVFFGNDTSSKKIPPSKTNKDKYRSNSTNNNNEYDLLCIKSIQTILKQIQDKLDQEKSKNKINDRCYQIIDRINNNKTDLLRRKKNTYLGILKILENIFSLLCDKKTLKNYNNEIFKILNCIQNYYKNIKKYDIKINNDTYYYNKKIAFKYVYSSLEIKTYDNNSMKELTKKDYNEENFNNLLKFKKDFKRYKKTSEYLYKEVKEFIEKINNPSCGARFKTKFLQKYESCPSYIQILPNFISYKKLFNHYIIILNFFTDYKSFEDELVDQKKNKIIDAKREKSVQKMKNGVDLNSKNRERSRYKDREKEKEIEKDKEKKSK